MALIARKTAWPLPIAKQAISELIFGKHVKHERWFRDIAQFKTSRNDDLAVRLAIN